MGTFTRINTQNRSQVGFFEIMEDPEFLLSNVPMHELHTFWTSYCVFFYVDCSSQTDPIFQHKTKARQHVLTALM